MKWTLLIALALQLAAPGPTVSPARAGEQSSVTPASNRQMAGVEPRRVLALFWHPSTHPASDTFDRYFHDELKRQFSTQTGQSAGAVEYYAEYFESARFPGESQEEVMRDYLRRKYASRKIDVLLAWGQFPLAFLVKHHRDLFPDASLVHYTTDLSIIRDLDTPAMTGVLNTDAYEKTLELALRLHPDTSDVFFISGTPGHDREIEREGWLQLERFRDRINLTYLTDLPLDQLIATLKGVPRQSVIIYSRQSQEDPQAVLDTIDFLDVVSRSAPVPVYAPWSSLMGHGAVGGFLDNPKAGATRAAEIVVRVLRGARPQDIPPVMVDKIPTFDERQLKRWRISEASLPAGSVILFRQPTLWSQYWPYILATGVLLCLQTLLISGLLVQRVRRRRVEGALRESDKRYALATMAGSVGVWDWTPATNEMWIDASLKRALGYQDLEIENRFDTWLEHVHPGDAGRLMADAYAHIDGETPAFENEHRMLHRDGTIRWFLTRGTAVRANDGAPLRIIGTDTDITGRKDAEIRLEELRHELARVSRVTTLAQFAASIAHEASQPLSAILMNTKACLRWLGSSTPPADELRTTLHDIANAAKQANEVVTRNRGMFARRAVERQVLDMNGIVRDVAALARPRLHKELVQLETVLEPDLPEIVGDSVELQQVLLNLLLNAIESVATATGSSKQIWVRTAADHDVRVSVRDTGTGLRGVDTDALFKAFYTTKETGTGVGLSISRFIVEDHGGRLWAESHEDGGATFCFTIPAAEPIESWSHLPDTARPIHSRSSATAG